MKYIKNEKLKKRLEERKAIKRDGYRLANTVILFATMPFEVFKRTSKQKQTRMVSKKPEYVDLLKHDEEIKDRIIKKGFDPVKLIHLLHKQTKQRLQEIKKRPANYKEPVGITNYYALMENGDVYGPYATKERAYTIANGTTSPQLSKLVGSEPVSVMDYKYDFTGFFNDTAKV